jgi:hypothetical protein
VPSIILMRAEKAARAHKPIATPDAEALAEVLA